MNQVIVIDESTGEVITLEHIAIEANDLFALAEGAAGSAVEYAQQCGDKLIQAKSMLKHGEWLPWLEANFKGSHKTSTKYMKIAANMNHGSTLPESERPESIRQALKLLAETTSAAERLVANETNEWYTPVHIVDAARRVMGGIDLDPASNDRANGWINADNYYTQADDSLTKPWAGRVWINPPYGGQGPAFTRKLFADFESGAVTQAILLVNGTAGKDNWFQPLFNFPLCWMQPLRFINEEGNEQAKAMFASVAVYFGPNEKAFIREFAEIGVVLKRCLPLVVICFQMSLSGKPLHTNTFSRRCTNAGSSPILRLRSEVWLARHCKT